MKYDSKVIADWIGQIQENGRGLTKWEEEFVSSVDEQMEAHGRISDRQEEILERIYAEKS